MITIKNHMIDSYEMGRRMVPAYISLFLNFLPYLFVASLLGTSAIYFGGILGLILAIFAVIATIVMFVFSVRYEIAKLTLTAAGYDKKENPDKAWNDADGNFWTAIHFAVVTMFIVMLGLLALVLPAIYLAFLFSFAPFFMFVRFADSKKLTGFERIKSSLKSSKALVKGNFGTVFLRAFLIFMIASVLMWPAQSFEHKLRDQYTVYEAQNDMNGQQGRPVFNFEIKAEALNFKVISDAITEAPGRTIVYILYSIIVGFLLECFGYSYWYILFVTLEKSAETSTKKTKK